MNKYCVIANSSVFFSVVLFVRDFAQNVSRDEREDHVVPVVLIYRTLEAENALPAKQL